ncbi:DUF4349 domain-containing protein [Aeromicrobium sp. IC_218]|uniref:DUF4349 domain-containing protein n=1 Tax=Aeromicrobium sp. IC_218 TaxID=2545468 RepID=UPI00103CBA98|nr:DUF4349 domain-containing protein [Aeromicrobium sp. IC_218]TCI98708.1 DUF4349 domain-containing protein [Aeromicrobium sp. IC_218]
MNPRETDRPGPPELGDDRVAAMRGAIDRRIDAEDHERSRRRRTAILAAAAAVVVGTSAGLAVDVLPPTTAGDGDALSAVTAEGYSYEAAPPTTPAELEAQAYVDARPDPDFFPGDWAVPLSEVRASGNAHLDVPDAEATADDLRSWMPGADGRVELASVDQDGDDTTALLRLRFPASELDTVSDHLASLDDDSLVRVTQRSVKTDGGAKEQSLSSLTPRAGRVADAVLYVVLSTQREPEEPQQAALERGSDAVAAALPWVGGALVGAVGVLWARRPRGRRS